MTWVEIVNVVLDERLEQTRTGKDAHDALHSPADWVAILCRHLGLSVGDEARVDRRAWRKQMARVAAIAMAALEADAKRPAGPTPQQRGAQVG